MGLITKLDGYYHLINLYIYKIIAVSVNRESDYTVTQDGAHQINKALSYSLIRLTDAKDYGFV